MGKGLGSVEKRQNSKKAWGVRRETVADTENRVGHAGVGTERERKKGRDGATIYLLENKKAYLN